jgi:ABC-type multidrug transport system fused ATPase/permease subunit
LTGLAGTTTLLIATRPTTIAIADEVLFVEEGRLAARGTHAALLTSTPAYAALVRAYERSEVSP